MSKLFIARRLPGTFYTLGEEIANAITAGIGAALAVAGLVIMVVFAAVYGTAWHVVGVGIFGVSLVFAHLASTLYHSIMPPRAKAALRVMDHLAIYILIAGTYTPFALVNLRGLWGWTLLFLIWSLSLVGIVIKTTRLRHVNYLSPAFYIAMGWVALLVLKPLLAHVAPGGIWLLLAGGLAYTGGVIFYALDDHIAYNHAIWHLFVLAGSVFHFFAVLFYVIPLAGAASDLAS